LSTLDTELITCNISCFGLPRFFRIEERLGFVIYCRSPIRNIIHCKQDEADFDEGPREASDVSQV